MWRAACTGRPASLPNTSAGIATAICATAMATRIQRNARLVSGSPSRRSAARGSAPMAVRMPGVRSGIAGAARAARCGAAPRRRCENARQSAQPARCGVDASTRRVRGPRRRAGRRSPGGSACRSYEVVAAAGLDGFPPVSSVAVDELTRLFLAARDGDRTALLHAIRTSQADVWRLAAHLVGPDDADDVTQDTFVRAWRALPGLPRRLQRPHLAALDHPPGVRRRRSGAPCAAGGWRGRLEHRGTAPGRGQHRRPERRPRGLGMVDDSPTTSGPRSCSRR